MKLLITGGTSFTGAWFIRALHAAGHTVAATLTGERETYGGVRRERIEALGSACEWVPSAGMGSEALLEWIRSEPVDVFCHHGAQVGNYKDPGFDAVEALEANTRGLPVVLDALREGGCRKVVLTGTTFEPNEGAGEEPLRAFSPYGLSKGLTAEVFRYYCHAHGLSLGKFVIPNPFGPGEERGFTRYLVETWKRGETAQVQTPDYLRDNIHVDLLARCYVVFLETLASEPGHFQRMNPSGYAERQGAFARRFAREVGGRLGLEAGLEFLEQTAFPEPRERVNTLPATVLVPDWDEAGAWDAVGEYYRGGGGEGV